MPMCPCNDPPRNREVPPPFSPARPLRVAVVALALFLDGPIGIAQTPGTRIHPAVVRVMVQDKAGRSHGSGALVAVTDTYGLVLTNWHVVRDAAAPPTVVFPDGFQSAATIARIDRDWDLAALVIWRPRADPIPLATAPPRPGEPLAIAGYGKGQYRVATGRCTQYLSPGRQHPFELVELSASARQGDSGGPIFNDRGELAGVLFGSAFGRTTGSHSGRVRQFLAPLWHDFYRIPDDGSSMIAARPQPGPPVASIQGVRPGLGGSGLGVSPGNDAVPVPRGPGTPSVLTAPGPTPGHPGPAPPPPGLADRLGTSPFSGATHPFPSATSEPWVASTPPASDDLAPALGPPSRSEQLKTILAAIGILALVFHGVRLLSRAVEV